MSKVAVFLYDFTGLMAAPWLAAGYTCYSFDGQHPPGITCQGAHYKVGLWFDANDIKGTIEKIISITGSSVQFLFGFPECTHLTSAGARHWHSKWNADPNFQLKAIKLADLVSKLGAFYGSPWGFENPKGKLNTFYRPSDFSFDPCDFGGYLPDDDQHPLYPQIYPGQDAYKKETHIWCGGGFKEPSRKPVSPQAEASPGWALLGGKSTRTKNIRSCTPRGFSLAVFLHNADYDWESLL